MTETRHEQQLIMSKRQKPSGAQGRARRREDDEKQERDGGNMMNCMLEQNVTCWADGTVS